MFYQIISYDKDNLIANVKVATTSTRLNTGPIIPVSIENMESQSDFEKAVYISYAQTVAPRQRANFSNDIELFVYTNTNVINAFSIPIVPIGVAQSSSSDAPSDSSTSTNVQVL
jgi:hypothetical protein